MKDFKIDTDELERIVTHLPSGIQFRFTPTDTAPEGLDPDSVLLYDDLGGIWIGQVLAGQHDDTIMQAAWEAVNGIYWKKKPEPRVTSPTRPTLKPYPNNKGKRVFRYLSLGIFASLTVQNWKNRNCIVHSATEQH